MQSNQYRAVRKSILSDPATSDWLRAALDELDKRDPIDAAMDAAILAKLADLRMTADHGIQYATHVCLDQVPSLSF